MRRIALSIFALLALVLFSQPALAAGEVKVGYSADAYMETADGVMEGPVYYMPGKERREYVEDGSTMVMIIRHDKKVVWMLMPDDRMYMESKFPKEGRKDDLGSYDMEHTTVGPETVNGVKTTKSKVIMTAKDGSKLGGFFWQTKEGIAVKLDAISVDKDGKERFKTELNNLKIGSQDAALFEIPSGYTQMGMGGFGSMLGGGSDDDDGGDGGDDGDDGGGDDAKQQPSSGKKKGFGLRNAIDLLNR